jgi:hypothetical protein
MTDTPGWQVNASVPHPARIYDYWLGGKDNFEADREAAEAGLLAFPELRDYAAGNRKFLTRAVAFLRDQGIRQFLDIGSGFPTSPNVHEVAGPDARVVYVDNDPMVFLHAEALMAISPDTEVIRADMRDSDSVLAQADGLLDFAQPTALMFVASLHHLTDADDPAGIVARYLGQLSPGSYLVLSHFTSEFAPERVAPMADRSSRRGVTSVPRDRAAIEAMFNGRELVEPGLVQVSYWRPDAEPDQNADRVWALGGIASLT